VRPIERMIDANVNRAREALRVMEDIARFALDDGEIGAGLKSLRHDLTDGVAGLGLSRRALLESRDSVGDVGREISTESEQARAGVAGMAGAAGSRLSEALRSLEEAAKVLGKRAAAARFEMIRYRAYDFDRALSLALVDEDASPDEEHSPEPTREHLPEEHAASGGDPAPSDAPRRARQWRLCVLITESECTHLSWQEVAIEALSAGADCLQLREKTLLDDELLRRARVLVGLTRDHGADLVINDRPDVAMVAGATGVHLGRQDLPIDEVRRVAGRRLVIGGSCAEMGHVARAMQFGADVFGLGPMFPSSTKPRADLSGPDFLAEALNMLDGRPHLAISGITNENVGPLVEAGCRGVAVCSFVCSSARPGAACERLLSALG